MPRSSSTIMPLATRRIVASIALCLSGALGLTAGQSAPPQSTFRAGVDLVDVEVSVLDRYRLPVRGLTASDFTVLEEGQPRPVAAFTSVDLPSRQLRAAKWMVETTEDVQTNDFSRAGRLIVVLMDQSIEPSAGAEARRIAEAAIDQMRPGDLAAVTWSMFGVPQNFTADRRRLVDAIRQPALNLPNADAGSGLCYCGACGLELMANVAEAIQDVRQRRKVLLFVGHRIPQGRTGCGGVVDAARRRALRAAEVGNLTIHVLDPQGLSALPDFDAAQSGTARQQDASADLRRVSNLSSYTGKTGGRLVLENKASEVVSEVFRESGSYYVLGFQPAYTKSDGRFRRITVNVNRPNVTVQARGGYYAAGRAAAKPPKIPKGLPAPLVDAIAGLWPSTSMRLSLGAMPVAVPGGGGAVAVLLNVEQDLSPSGPLGTLEDAFFARPHSTKASVLTGAFDASGQPYGFDEQAVEVTPRPTGDRTFSYEIASRLQLKPGHYEVRAAVNDSTLGQTASVYADVTVPDFAREAVSLSGVFLQAGAGRAMPPGARLGDLITAVPTSRRSFRRDEHVTAFVESYQGGTRDALPGYMITEIYDDADLRVYQQELRVVPAGPTQRTASFRVDLPLERLAPGPYLLTMQIRQGNRTATRDVKFDVQ